MRQYTLTVATQKIRAGTAREQDTAAFEAFFLQHYQRVYQVVFRLVGDPAQADDLTLEAFWRLWNQRLRSTNNLQGWLFRVATNLGYNALRADKRRSFYENRGQPEHDSSPDPTTEALRADDRERVRRTLRRMPARQAQLLILRHSDFSYQEIAAALDLAPNSIGTLLARAEREFVKKYEEGE